MEFISGRDDFISALILELELQKGYDKKARELSGVEVFRKLCFDFPDIKENYMNSINQSLNQLIDQSSKNCQQSQSYQDMESFRQEFWYHNVFIENLVSWTSSSTSSSSEQDIQKSATILSAILLVRFPMYLLLQPHHVSFKYVLSKYRTDIGNVPININSTLHHTELLSLDFFESLSSVTSLLSSSSLIDLYKSKLSVDTKPFMNDLLSIISMLTVLVHAPANHKIANQQSQFTNHNDSSKNFFSLLQSSQVQSLIKTVLLGNICSDDHDSVSVFELSYQELQSKTYEYQQNLQLQLHSCIKTILNKYLFILRDILINSDASFLFVGTTHKNSPKSTSIFQNFLDLLLYPRSIFAYSQSISPSSSSSSSVVELRKFSDFPEDLECLYVLLLASIVENYFTPNDSTDNRGLNNRTGENESKLFLYQFLLKTHVIYQDALVLICENIVKHSNSKSSSVDVTMARINSSRMMVHFGYVYLFSSSLSCHTSSQSPPEMELIITSRLLYTLVTVLRELLSLVMSTPTISGNTSSTNLSDNTHTCHIRTDIFLQIYSIFEYIGRISLRSPGVISAYFIRLPLFKDIQTICMNKFRDNSIQSSSLLHSHTIVTVTVNETDELHYDTLACHMIPLYLGLSLHSFSLVNTNVKTHSNTKNELNNNNNIYESDLTLCLSKASSICSYAGVKSKSNRASELRKIIHPLTTILNLLHHETVINKYFYTTFQSKYFHDIMTSWLHELNKSIDNTNKELESKHNQMNSTIDNKSSHENISLDSTIDTTLTTSSSTTSASITEPTLSQHETESNNNDSDDDDLAQSTTHLTINTTKNNTKNNHRGSLAVEISELRKAIKCLLSYFSGFATSKVD